jgi:hypothetical protein
MPTLNDTESTTTSLAAPANESTQWTVDDIRKSDILVFRNSQSQYIDSVVAPNGLQVGLLDENFLTDLLVTGHITGSGIIYSELGFSGSLQTLIDGSNYLVGEGGISITNNDDGSITISGGGGSAGSRTKKVINAAAADSQAYDVPNIFFADYSYSADLIDVYINGELLTSGTLADNTADFTLGTDTVTGGVIYFKFGVTASDDVTVIVGSSGSGGGGSTYSAGTGLSLAGSIFDVDVDTTTITTNSSDQLTVARVPNQLGVGNGLQGTSFDGSSNSAFSVKPVAGSPVTVSGAGVDFSLGPVSAVSLQNTDELLISQGGSLGKITVSDLVTAAGGNPGVTSAAYLVAQSSGALSAERVLAGGNGIQVSDDASAGTFEVSVVLESNGGLQIISGNLAVKAADFAGFGLSESAGQLSIDPSAFAGTGLTAAGNQLNVNFGSGANQAAKGTNTLTITAADGLNLGGTATLGDTSSNISLAVESADLAGLGINVANNNLDVYLSGQNGIQVLTGSNNELVIDGTSLQGTGNIASVSAGPGLQGGGSSGALTLQVDYDDAANVIMDAYDGTSITVDSENDRVLLYDSDETQVKYVKPSQIGGSGSGTIGSPEDGTWDDGLGLWNDFTDSTPTGTAIDRINEVLKALAPPPAPTVRSIDYSVTGGSIYSGLLSFDASHPDSNGEFTEVTTYTQQSQSGFAALGVGESYETDSITSANNNHDGSDLYFYRVGVLTGIQTITGEVNFNVASLVPPTGVVQYTEDCFGDADIGSLILEVNNSQVHTMDLTDVNLGISQPPDGDVNSTSLNVQGSGFTHVSETRSAYTEGGTEFSSFKHRSANYVIAAASMQKGFNTARVIHAKGSNFVTNYIEWVVDDTDTVTDAIGFSNTSVTPTNALGSLYISGVRYHSSIDLDYQTDISNAYKAVHSDQQITTSTSAGDGGSGTSIPTMGVSDSMDKVINFTQTIPIIATTDILLNQTVATNITVPHPIKGSASGGNTVTDPILLYTVSSSASPTAEDFNLEAYRLQAGAYTTQTAGQVSGFYDVNQEWNSQEHLFASGAGHETGLQIYNGKLLSPLNSIDTASPGDFRSIGDGGVLVTYSGNPDYSTSGGNIDPNVNRTYYRWFKNNSGSSKRDIQITYNGVTDLSPAAAALGNNNIKVYIKFPENTATVGTGWMDANSAYTMFDDSDGDGGYVGTLTTAISGAVTNYFSFGQKEVLDDEVIILKVEADPSWDGNIDALSVQWGASAAGLEITAQPLEQVSIVDNGVDVKLSFGVTNDIGYDNVTNLTTSADVDFNSLYSSATYVRGALVSVLANGVVMSNFNSRFDDAYLGTLQLEVNGVLIVDSLIDLTNFSTSGNFIDADGTGFYNVSAATPSVYNGTNIQSYDNIYRSADVQVAVATQVQGHNYYRVIHDVDGVDIRYTNYCEWVIDGDTTTFESTGEEMENWTDLNEVTQSGIKYFQSPESVVKYRINGAYSNVYSPLSDAIGWINPVKITLGDWDIIGTGINNSNAIGSQHTSLPSLVVGGHIDPIDVTGSISWNGSSKVMPGSLGINSSETASISARVYHPLKEVSGNNYVDTATVSKTDFLIHSGFSDTSTDISENFSAENYRVPSSTDFSLAGNISQGMWTSSESLVGPGTGTNEGHEDGLCVYNGNLVAPANAGSNADFRNVSDGGTLQGPSNNVNYSLLSGSDERVYIRPFYNNTGSSKSRFDITITGVGILTSENQSDNSEGALDADNFKLFVKIVEPTAAPATTGWLDCGEHSNSSVADYSGCRYGALNSELPINISTTNSFEIVMPSGRDLNAAGSNLLLIKVVTNEDWTGRITSLGVSL